MSGKGNAKPSGFVWDQIEKFINDRLSMMNPFGKAAADSFMQKHPDWVERLVGQVLDRTLPKPLKPSAEKPSGSTKPAAVSTEVFETHQHVIAKIKLPRKEHPRALQVMVRSDRIKLLGLLGGEPYYIQLPAPVLASTARAKFKEGILQVQARKRKKGAYRETYIE
jgi:hypothetical protein